MAYEKKTVQEYIAETDDKTVEGFDDNQETRIKAGFDNIADYPIGTGSNYTKWNSGKLEQWGSVNVGAGVNQYVITQVVPFVRVDSLVVTGRYIGGGTPNQASVIYTTSFLDTLLSFYRRYNGAIPDFETMGAYYAVGKWK